MADRSPDRHSESTLRRIFQGQIRELTARIDALEARLAKVEGKRNKRDVEDTVTEAA